MSEILQPKPLITEVPELNDVQLPAGVVRSVVSVELLPEDTQFNRMNRVFAALPDTEQRGANESAYDFSALLDPNAQRIDDIEIAARLLRMRVIHQG